VTSLLFAFGRSPNLAAPSGALGGAFYALGQLCRSRRAIPLLERVTGDLSLYEKLSELPALGLALEWHRAVLNATGISGQQCLDRSRMSA
jgi:hypothetical protein